MRLARLIASVLLVLAIADNARAQAKEPLKAPSLNNDLFGVALTTPLPLLYLEQDSVRAELKLTKEQIDKLDVLGKSWQSLAAKQNLEGGDRRDLMGGFSKQINNAISAEQRTRLDQIVLRHREREYGLPAVLASIKSDLKLSPKQQEEFDRLRAQRAETVLEHLTSGERANAIRKKVHETNLEYVERVDTLLDKEQQAKLKVLFGEPFAGEIRLKDPVIARPATQKQNSIYLDFLYSYYSFEAEFLINESVQKELKMSNDQIRRAKEFHVEWSTKIQKGLEEKEDPIATLQIQHVMVRDNLKEILVENQRFRFRQIMLQHRAKISGPAAVVGYEDMAKLLDTSNNQVASLRSGKAIEDVLLRDQIKQLDAALGKPFTGEVIINHAALPKQTAVVGIDRPTLQGGRPIDVNGRLVNEKLNTFANHLLNQTKRLRLTEDQEKRLRELAEDAPTIRQLLHKELSNLPPPTVHGSARTMLPEAKAAEHLRKAIFDQCFDVLDPKQQSLFGGELKKAYKDY